ncbi:ArsC/Spx/MgsR family protein [Lactococcus kimchii]|uniref:ArsC/Spx/MgsR family protein n=1 Tax=Lactococcus sp. S-13 TaxID=2507158 RepID=UPI0010236098|nr:ArsC/Spx/MgsR family protein [Lactococcus sp. S-13]RZI48219.1 Spx-like protein [Lactococcus sp. S-13]
MITIYRAKAGSVSTRQAIKFMEHYHIPFKLKDTTGIDKKDLRKILQLSNGFEDILVSKKKAKKVYLHVEEEVSLDDLSFNEMIKLIYQNPQLLRQPIIFDDHKLLVGYNSDDIRTFLPRSLRNDNTF